MTKSVQPPDRLHLSLHSPCTVARQDAASPEAEQRLGGAIFNRAGANGARLATTIFPTVGKLPAEETNSKTRKPRTSHELA